MSSSHVGTQEIHTPNKCLYYTKHNLVEKQEYPTPSVIEASVYIYIEG